MNALTPVESSAVSAWGYDSTTRVLTIQSKTGKPYRYADVPPETINELAGSKSFGKAWGTLIRGQFEVMADEPQKETQQ